MSKSSTTTRRAAIGAIAAAAIVPATAMTATAGSDPVFAAIEAAKDAERIFDAAFDIDEDSDDCKQKLEIFSKAEDRLMEMHPTTFDGLLVQLSYFDRLVEDFETPFEFWQNIQESIRRLAGGAQ